MTNTRVESIPQNHVTVNFHGIYNNKIKIIYKNIERALGTCRSSKLQVHDACHNIDKMQGVLAASPIIILLAIFPQTNTQLVEGN